MATVALSGITMVLAGSYRSRKGRLASCETYSFSARMKATGTWNAFLTNADVFERV
jgi:hypothetical protein